MYALSVDIITTTIMSTITMTMKMDTAVDTTTIMTTTMSTITMTMKTDSAAVDMTMIIRSSTASDYNCKAVAEYLKQVYAELGVNINIEIVDSSLYKERQQEGTYDMTLTVFGINNADPTSTFKQYFASEGNSNKTLNYNYYNEKIDELVAKAPTIADVEERSKIYDEIQQELFDDSACVPICYQINVNIHNKAITHYAGKTFGVGLPTISWVK